MKTSFSLLAFLFFFSFSGFGQVVDTAAVVREVDSLIQISRTLTGKRDFGKALEVSASAEKLALGKLGGESAAYGSVCFNHGRIMDFKGAYPETEKWYLESKSIREKVLGREHPDYASSLNNLGGLYRILGKYEEAELLFIEAINIRAKVLGKENLHYAGTLNNLAVLYWETGSYEKAEPMYLEAKNIYEKILGKEDPDYAKCLNNVAGLYMAMGNFEKAEPLLLESKAIREKVLGKEHPDYAASLNNLANLYWEIGNYEKAESLYLESKAIREKVLGREHPDYASTVENLGLLYWWGMMNFEKAEPLYLEAKTIYEKVLGKEHQHYAATLFRLANLYSEMEKYEKAELLYIEAKAIREKTLGKDHPEYAESVANLAFFYWKMGNYEKAEPLYLEAKTIREKILGREHPDYAPNLNNLALLYWTIQKFDAAGSFLSEAQELDKSLLLKATRYLSEQEISFYVAKFANGLNKTFSLAQIRVVVAPACYNNTLFYKGFLLNTSSQINRITLYNPETAEIYNLLKSCHQRLAAEYAQPISERKDVAELEEKANSLEKELVRIVSGYGEAVRQVTWQEVQAALKPDEAAIEFIRFHYHNPNPTDSTLYAALLVKPGMTSPAFISLFEEKQLDALLAPLSDQSSSGLNELYGGQASQSLHRLLWSPIEPHLAGVKTVYYSPAGLLHRLNLSAIPFAQGKILADRHELVCLSSTRSLAEGTKARQLVTAPAFVPSAGKPATATTSATATATAIVYGGIQFDMDSAAYPVRSNLQDDDFSNRRGLSFSQSDSTLRLTRRSLGKGEGDSWQYLKWSEKEADNVQNILAKAGIAAETRKGWQATEESFKQIGTDKLSPRILHISTHGFFFPDPKSEVRSEAVRSEMSEPVFKISDHPMIRAGLVLAGGNHAWKTGQPLGNREDGILTAYEISQLDLRNTDLVVLSACETGLGHIEGNEGVYGLQRAFKIAGAKNLVMSLWQVPDYQTQELMTAFYRNMLEKEMPVRQALHAAQDEMRQKRYEPFYWAGFVLVE